jgi:hypothetical protein
MNRDSGTESANGGWLRRLVRRHNSSFAGIRWRGGFCFIRLRRLVLKAADDVRDEPFGKAGDKTPEYHLAVIAGVAVDGKDDLQSGVFCGAGLGDNIGLKMGKQVTGQQARNKQHIRHHCKDAAHERREANINP